MKRQYSSFDLKEEEQYQKDTKTVKKRKMSINDVLMKNARKKKPLHSWLNILTWGEPNKNGNYSRKLGDKSITVYTNKEQQWQYVYNKKHSTAYSSLEGVLSASYCSHKNEIHKFVPI
jgi:hypothetical protein